MKGSGHNVLIDTHGWYRQTIVSNGENGPVYRAFDRYFPYNRYSSCPAAPVTLPLGRPTLWDTMPASSSSPDVSSTRTLKTKGYGEDYVNAICWMLQNYD